MSARIVDVRLVLDRDDVLRVYVEGRAVPLDVATDDPSIVLFELARRLDSHAWSASRPALDVLADPDSPLFDGGPPCRRP